jgi:hypothetical protein
MGIKKLIVSGCNSLNLLGVGELTPLEISMLMPDSIFDKSIWVLDK